MSNDFWIGLAVIGGAYLYFHRGPKTANPNANLPPLITPPEQQNAQGTNTYGPFPGATSQGAAGIDTNPTGGDSGTLDNSRLYDPYAQSTTDQGNY